jgi:hypothetical protein
VSDKSKDDAKIGKPKSAKRENPRSDLETWNNLCKALAEDSLKDKNPSELSEEEIKRVQEKINDAIEKTSHVARMEEKLAKEAERRKRKYIN